MKSLPAMKMKYLVLIVGCLLTVLVAFSFMKSNQAKNTDYFNDLIEDQTKSIHTRFEYYYEALEGGASLYAASEQVSLIEWKAFLNRSQINKRRPGVNGIGVIVPVQNKELDSFVRQVRKDDIVDFKIRKVPNVEPPKDNAISSYIIKFIEPINVNKQARGLDIGSESNRRTSANLARDTGLPTISKKITLVQASKRGAGFLLFVPMYESGSPPPTVEERRKEFTGWVYAPFVTSSFFNSALINTAKEFHFYVFEGKSTLAEDLLFTTDQEKKAIPDFDELTSLTLGQQTFTVGWIRSHAFVSSNSKIIFVILFTGIFITILFSSLIDNLETTNQRAQVIADEQTHLLRENESKLEEALGKSKEAVKVKSEFLANMSHEIRTPMNGVLGMVQTLSETKLDSEQEEMVDLIKKSGDSLMIILNDILDLSKIESNKIEIENLSFNIEDCIEGAISLFKHESSRKGIGMSFENRNSSTAWFRGDVTRVKQIIINLLSNAIKFTENGEVKVELIVEELSPKECEITINVKDTGIGIDEKSQKNLFDKFSQADSSITRKYGGTGLGLSISSKLAIIMGGELSFSNNQDIGSIFTLKINLERGEAEELLKVDVVENQQEGQFSKNYPHNILVVEDNVTNQKLITMMLEKFGYTVDLAEDGLEALSAVKQNRRYTLILMDIQMPHMDGLTATAKIIEYLGHNAPTIVAVTANAFDHDIKMCKQAGMVDALLKPINKEKLKEILIRYSDENKDSPESIS
ncbi:CHASE domain-containing protein [Halobacteriovorax marinus]|uniref:CHASE domain-containing protein n=1 Tax=Halobacteriovorax marinus TaxID=97084 RepID=UPI003A924DEF